MWRVAIYQQGTMVLRKEVTEVMPAFLIASWVQEGGSIVITGRNQNGWILKKVKGKLLSMAREPNNTPKGEAK